MMNTVSWTRIITVNQTALVTVTLTTKAIIVKDFLKTTQAIIIQATKTTIMINLMAAIIWIPIIFTTEIDIIDF